MATERIYSPTLPTARRYRKPQFSFAKKRSGKESVPLFGLASGTHRLTFFNEGGECTCNIKVWLSPYGWAWRIIK